MNLGGDFSEETQKFMTAFISVLGCPLAHMLRWAPVT
jgi:hypothetical protein